MTESLHSRKLMRDKDLFWQFCSLFSFLFCSYVVPLNSALIVWGRGGGVGVTKSIGFNLYLKPNGPNRQAEHFSQQP